MKSTLISRNLTMRYGVYAVIGVLFACSSAYAEEIIYQQPSYGTEMSSSSPNVWWKLGTNYSGVVSSLDLYGNRAGATGTLEVTIKCYTTSAYSVRCPNTEMGGTGHALVATTTLNSYASFHYVNFSTSGTSSVYRTMSASRYYDVEFLSSNGAGAGVGDIDIYGTSSPNICYASASGHCTGSPYTYLRTVDTDLPADFTESYIVNVSSPSPGETTSSTLVTLSYAYWNTGYEGFNTSGVELSNLSAGQNISVSEQAISSSGLGSYSNSITLVENSTYLMRACLRNSLTAEKVCSVPIIFYVVSNPSGQTLIPVESDDQSGANSLFSGFFGIPSAIVTRFPFNWFQEIANELRATTSDSIAEASLTLDFEGISSSTDDILGNEPIVLFSSSTIEQYAPSGFLNLIKVFITAALYLGLMANVFFTIKNLLG